MDRRVKTRTEWNGPIKYRLLQIDPYKTGILADISTSGAMLWLDEELDMGVHVEIVMQSEYDPEPVHMHMHVVRTEDVPREGYLGYGCELEMSVSEMD